MNLREPNFALYCFKCSTSEFDRFVVLMPNLGVRGGKTLLEVLIIQVS